MKKKCREAERTKNDDGRKKDEEKRREEKKRKERKILCRYGVSLTDE